MRGYGGTELILPEGRSLVMTQTLTVLFVDDEDDVRAPLAAQVRIAGFRVLEARNTPEALRVLAQEHVDVLFSTQSSSEDSLGLVLREADTDRVVHAIQRLFRTELKHGVLNPVNVHRDIAVIAVLGSGMKGTCGIIGRLFSAVARANVSVIAVAQGASELNICFAVPGTRSDEVVRAVHQEFLGGSA